MTDVSYRINTNLPVRTEGTAVVTAGAPMFSGSFLYYRAAERTLPNEHGGSGLANRFDDRTYYNG